MPLAFTQEDFLVSSVTWQAKSDFFRVFRFWCQFKIVKFKSKPVWVCQYLHQLSVFKCTGFPTLDLKSQRSDDTFHGQHFQMRVNGRENCFQKFVLFHFCLERRKMVTTCSPWWWGSPVVPNAPEVWSEPWKLIQRALRCSAERKWGSRCIKPELVL